MAVHSNIHSTTAKFPRVFAVSSCKVASIGAFLIRNAVALWVHTWIRYYGIALPHSSCHLSCHRYYQSLDRGHQERFQGHLVTFLSEPQTHEKTRSIWVDWMHKVELTCMQPAGQWLLCAYQLLYDAQFDVSFNGSILCWWTRLATFWHLGMVSLVSMLLATISC